MEELERSRSQFLGYNVVCGDWDGLHHFSNVSGGATRLDAGVHGVSNALLNTPWPKVVRGVAGFEQLGSGPIPDVESLFEIIMDPRRAAREDLPRGTGVSEEKEWCYSSLFVEAPGYATRSSTVVIFRADGSIEFTERTHFPVAKEVKFCI